MINKSSVPISERYALSIREAAEYSGIGENKIRKLVMENLDAGFVLQIGSRCIIKRQKFEEYLDQQTAI